MSAPQPSEAPVEKHDADALCFFCATDNDLGRALAGAPHRTIHMDLPAAACPHWEDEAVDRG